MAFSKELLQLAEEHVARALENMDQAVDDLNAALLLLRPDAIPSNMTVSFACAHVCNASGLLLCRVSCEWHLSCLFGVLVQYLLA